MSRRSTVVLSWWAAVFLLGACASVPKQDLLVERLKSDLDNLRREEAVKRYAPLALAEADRAVRRLDQAPGKNELREHLAYLATRRMDIARAEARRAEAADYALALERDKAGLLVRFNRLQAEQALAEADRARLQSLARSEEAEQARARADASRRAEQEAAAAAAAARQEAEKAHELAKTQSEVAKIARREAELAAEQAQSLKRRLERLQLRQTDRGVVVTLGDVLFATGQAALTPQSAGNLDTVVELLAGEPERRVRIEGHTDDRGDAAFNTALSERRAAAVRDALVTRGIDAQRITVVGMGEDFPIAGNDTAEGRAQNRRVDVILLDADTARE